MNDAIEGDDARFLPEVEAALRRMKWFPGRQVAEDVLQKWYVFQWEDAPGYCRIFPAAYRFLREFGGLTLARGTEKCLIDPLEAVGNYEDFRIFDEWRLETCLYPLGEWKTGHILYIDLQSRLWDLPEPFLWGNSIEESLTNILVPGQLQPPDIREWKYIDQETEELIGRITKAEWKLTPK